jgi:hypothetical protein
MPATKTLAALALATLALAGCGGGGDDQAAKPTPVKSSTKPANCLPFPQEFGDAIAEGAKEGKLTGVRGAAMKSTEHKSAYYIAGIISDGKNEDKGVWASSTLTLGQGPILSVNGIAHVFTNWPKSNDKTGNMSIADKGAEDALALSRVAEPA